jgi:hypothetical protein
MTTHDDVSPAVWAAIRAYDETAARTAGHHYSLIAAAVEAATPHLIAAAESRGWQRAVAALDSPAVIDVLVHHQRKDIGGLRLRLVAPRVLARGPRPWRDRRCRRGYSDTGRPDVSRDPWGARDELKRRIRAKLAAAAVDPDALADRVMTLFYAVDDEWDRVETTTLGDSGERFIDNRWLVARVPVQGVHWERPVDRSVTE